MEIIYKKGKKEETSNESVEDIQAEPSFSVARPRLFFENWGLSTSTPVRGYDISLDGQRFLMVRLKKREPQSATEMILFQNWFEEIKRLVPAWKQEEG